MCVLYYLQMNVNKQKKRSKKASQADGAYLLKLALYVILGSLWLKVTNTGGSLTIPVPIGLLIGIAFTRHEHFQIDRKIEYAVLVIAALFGYLAPYGLYISL